MKDFAFPAGEGDPAGIRAVPSKWGPVALVCRKCGKKLGGGFGTDGGQRLAKAAKRAMKAAGRRRALRLVETGCLGICPKGAVAVALSDRVLLVAAGTGADAFIDAAAAAGSRTPGHTPRTAPAG